MFEFISLLFVIVLFLFWLWLAFIGSVAAKYDETLEPFQRNAQMVICWLVPFIGASIVLYLVNQHSPNAIPRKFIPWPFNSIIFSKYRKPNTYRDEFEHDDLK